jgi:methyl coenzyme M reductase subunit D
VKAGQTGVRGAGGKGGENAENQNKAKRVCARVHPSEYKIRVTGAFAKAKAG